MAAHRTELDDGPTDDASSGVDLQELTQAVVAAVGRGGAAGAGSALEAVERAARRLVQRVVDAAVADPRPVGDHRALARALSKAGPGPAFGGATAAAVGTRVARRLGPARFAARRTPMWFAVTAVPAVYASIARGADELRLVTSHLVLRSRAAGIEPDPARLRRAAVQVVSGRAVHTHEEPSHGPLALAWGRRAVRAALPFTGGIKTKEPKAMASAAADVDAAQLAAAIDLRAGSNPGGGGGRS
jgi:hypothetical protein